MDLSNVIRQRDYWRQIKEDAPFDDVNEMGSYNRKSNPSPQLLIDVVETTVSHITLYGGSGMGRKDAQIRVL